MWRRMLPLGSLLALVVAGCMTKSTAPAPKEAAQRAAARAKVSTGPHRPAVPGVNVPAVKVDTVGYPQGWTKMAVFNVKPVGAKIVDAASGEEAYDLKRAKVDALGLDAASQDEVWQLDFTAFDRPGTYRIEMKGARSDPFTIGPGIYDSVLTRGLKALYLQRTRTTLDAPYAVFEGDDFTRSAPSHVHERVGWDIRYYPKALKDAALAAEAKKTRWKVEAGWHDAGNYDMYVPSTAPTAQALLMAYEWKPELWKDRAKGDGAGIPESGNGTPDILDEARWGIRWVLSVQEPDTGAFRLRESVATQEEVGAVPPEKDTKAVRWIDGVGSASTAKGCALAAMTARVYRPHDAAFATRGEVAARKAWAWLQKHPERVTVTPTGSAKSNPYLLWDDGPAVKTDFGARFVAATEMWKTFREPSALAWLKKNIDAPGARKWDLPYGGWTNLTRWGLMTLAKDDETPDDLRTKAKDKLVSAARSFRANLVADGYGCVSKAKTDYYWAHNSNLLEKAQLLLVAQELDPSQKWATQAARDQWHWILGRNPNGYSMVTRVGKGPTAMYHMEYGPMFPKVPPGFLVGGPNWDNMKFLSPEAPAKALLFDNPEPMRSGAPAHAMWHWAQEDLWEGGLRPQGNWDEGWWAVTEPDIYYQANLILVGAYMAAQD